MAKTSWIERDKRKRATVAKYAALRAELKAKKDYAGLSALPRDASPTRTVKPLPAQWPPPGVHPPFQALAYRFP